MTWARDRDGDMPDLVACHEGISIHLTVGVVGLSWTPAGRHNGQL